MTRPSARRLITRFTHAGIELAKSAGHWLGTLWSRHCELLRSNASYAATVGAAAASVFTQISGSDVVAVTITALVAIWTAVRHPGSRRPSYSDLSRDLPDLDRWS